MTLNLRVSPKCISALSAVLQTYAKAELLVPPQADDICRFSQAVAALRAKNSHLGSFCHAYASLN